MINAPKLYSHNLLTDLFGSSKCYVAAHILRDLGIYPKRRELTYRDASVYLYCLASTPESNVEVNVKRVADEVTHIKHSTGESFIDVFSQILKEETFHNLECIMVSQKGGLGYIEAVEGIHRVYFDERSPGIPRNMVNVYTQLSKHYLALFAAVIKERNLTYEQIN